MSLNVSSECRIVGPLGKIPAMDLSRRSFKGVGPIGADKRIVEGINICSIGCVRWSATLGASLQLKSAAHAVVLSVQEPKQIRERHFIPAHPESGRLQAGG